ncbi:methyl-accepting chemotaxis protein [Oryzomicrobium sp.]|uniref:HAMP domain-containing methyl-accepting chemotaxis protein n=1 Tax=Oryzomicrobium sp. TaxID=1911578 RepID=UPI0025DF372D|nr:methyl-accepting chemotaxis protein [Oryzomicrobium sp.]MCE1243400.1 methyl-accepting chemotaxis protein [Oryzomicrobium sp.]
MQWFDNLSLRTKLFLNFAISGGVLVLAILFCLLQIRQLGNSTNEIITNWLPSIQATGKISQERLRYRVRSLEYMLGTSPEERAKIESSLKKLDGDLQTIVKEYQPLISGPDEQKLVEQVQQGVADYRKVVEEGIALMNEGKMEEAQQLRRGAWVDKANKLRDATDALTAFNRDGASHASDDGNAHIHEAMTGGIVALALGLGIAIAASLLLSNRMSRQLEVAVETARRIAAGDLQGPVPAAGQDEVGKLIAAMAEMQRSLRTTLSQTRDNADRISSAAQQLNSGAAQLEQSASAQSAAASAIAANIEELTVSINHVSDSTTDSSRLAADSDTQARTGRDTLLRMVDEITRVSEVVNTAATQVAALEGQSAQISHIVSVIRDIADQTNLLALNAAIEAARAGEHGRGFAVVADEVRKLSERTAQSTSEITQMVSAIQESTRQVVAGIQAGVTSVDTSVTLAREAGDTVSQLQEMAQRVAQLVGDVAEALREQSSASTDVARRVEEIATHAEENSATTAETAGAARTLDGVARNMQEVVGRFRL